MKEPAEGQIIAEHIRQPDDGMGRQVKGQFHPGGGHARAAGPEEAGLEAPAQRLIIRRRNRLDAGKVLAQGLDQLGRQQVPAGLPCH